MLEKLEDLELNAIADARQGKNRLGKPRHRDGTK